MPIARDNAASLQEEDAAYMRKPDRGSFVANVISGVSAFSEHPYVLITTSDLPFLTGAVISDFIRQSLSLAQDNHSRFEQQSPSLTI